MPAATDARRLTLLELWLVIVDHIIHIILAAVIICVLWIPVTQYRYLLSWHAILGVTAFLFFMSESIMLFSKNPWYAMISRRNRVLIHGILLGIATILAILATCFEYHRKATRKGHRHFHSLHGVSALLATLCSIFASVGGLAVSNCDWIQSRLLYIRPVVLKLSHNIIGQAAYIMGIFSLCCAYYSNWMLGNTSPLQRAMLVLITGFIATWTLRQAFKSGYHQIQTLRDSNTQCDI